MKYDVVYLQPKKKKGHYAQQCATFLKIEDAAFWEEVVKNQGATDVEIIPKFN